MTQGTKARVDYSDEQYYNVPFGGAARVAERVAGQAEPMFSVRAEMAKLALNIEALEREYAKLSESVNAAGGESREIASGNSRKLEELSTRLDSLKAVFATRLSGVLPAIGDAIANLYSGLNSEIMGISRLISDIRPQAETPAVSADIDEKLGRIEGAISFRDRLDSDSKERREILDIISILDSFERLIVFLEESTGEGKDSWLAGIRSIHRLILDYLGKRGIRQIEELNVFDPHIHVAMATVAAPEFPEGKVSKVLQSGYLHKGKVLRFAEVVVVRNK